MKILIVVPSFKILGGVANHYIGLNTFWKNKIRYCFQGKREHIPAIYTLMPDFVNFIWKLIINRPDVVILNPSLRNYQLKRDMVYFKIAKLFDKKVITFIHGWDPQVASKISDKPNSFLNSFGKSQFIYVLYSGFLKSLKGFGVKCPVLLTTTKVSDSLLSNFDINTRDGNVKQILFLARIEKEKGIFITLEAFKFLKKKYNWLTLSVCGSGTALNEAMEFVEKEKIPGVIFHGNLSGDSLIKQFHQSQLYVLPTHGEGMATSVLESMAFGLPVITRPVGGVNDFFVNGQMGYLTESLNAEDYAELLGNFIENKELTKKISHYNHKFAINHFLASKVTCKFEQDINKYIN